MDGEQVRDCIAKAIPSLKSIGALAIRLGDLRPKADNAVQHVNWLAWNMPRVIARLVHKVHSVLDGVHRDKALQRLGSMKHEHQNHKVMQLDIPFLKGCNVIEAFKNFVLSQLPSRLSPRHTLLVKMRYKLPFSCKKILCNSKAWSDSIDHEDFRCTCSQLSSWLGAPPKHCEVPSQRGALPTHTGHYCQRWSVTKLARDFPEGFHAGTPLAFSMQDFNKQLAVCINRLDSECAVGLNSVEFRDWCSHHVAQTSVPSSSAAYRWKPLLDAACVVTPLDKAVSQLCLSCPRGWQLRFYRSAIGTVDNNFDLPPDLKILFEMQRERYEYCGVQIPIGSHRFGKLDFHQTNSDPVMKGRLLGSYAKHAFRFLFRLENRVIDNVLKTVVKVKDQCTVSSIEMVRRKVADFNSVVEDRLLARWNFSSKTCKRDLDSFFNKVPRTLIIRSADWLVAAWKQSVGRRHSIKIPKVKPVRIHAASYSRSFKGILRAKAAVYRFHEAGACNLDKHTEHYYVLRAAHVAPIIDFDLHVGGWLYFGTTLISPMHGMTQGSGLAPAVCGLCLVFLEFEFYCHWRFHTRFLVIFHARWVDDVFFKITGFWLDESSRLQVESDMDVALTSLCGIYSDWFALKVEDDSVFVGLSVSDVNGKIALQQDFSKNEVFQYGSCARPKGDAIKLVTSQLAMLCDCAIGCDVGPSLQLLACKFLRSGYSRQQLCQGVAKFVTRYPYLQAVILEKNLQ